MAFKNTVETVGDAALTRSIIDRSITELNCNITTSIRQQAFYACSALVSVNFPSVTSVAPGAFNWCTSLKKADFTSAVSFAYNVFYGCSALTALILRSTDQLCTISNTAFANSAIASGTGYIYVPAALVDQYKASWTTYAAQIRAIEDYPGIADAYSWAGVAANIADGSYASVYKVGDTVPLDLGGEGKVDMEVVGIDVDDLADGSGKAPISWIGKELLKTSKEWNPTMVTLDDGSYQEGTGAIGGWEKSELRVYCNDTLLSLIPSNVAALIKSVTKSHEAYDTAGSKFTQTTCDRLWIPGYNECVGNQSLYYPAYKNSSNLRKKNTQAGKGGSWWLRDAISKDSIKQVSNYGSSNGGMPASYTDYVALGFCT